MKTNLTTPILAFKIRPTKKSKLFYTVLVFETIEDMHSYSSNRPKKELQYKPNKNAAGLCSTWALTIKKKGKEVLIPDCGEILLCVGYLNPRIVVHEVSHAMFGLKRRKGIGDLCLDKNGKINSDNEEWAVDAIGQMTETVYRQITKAGLFD